MTLTALRKVLIGVGTVLLSSQEGAYKGVDASDFDDGVTVKSANAEYTYRRRELDGENVTSTSILMMTTASIPTRVQ